MKHIVKIILITFYISYYGCAQNIHIPFTEGEKLTYKIQYGPVNAGIANLEVKTFNNKYKYLAEGKSTGVFNMFFKVRDYYESIVDKVTLQPNRFYRNVNEGNYKKKEQVFFNYDLLRAESTRDTIPLPNNPQDILSIFYYLRSQNLNDIKENEIIPAKAFLDDEFMDSNLIYLGKDTIKTKFGIVPCLKFSPKLETGRVFKEDYSMKIWISDDANKVPVQVKSKILVGSIEMNLSKYSGTIKKIKTIKKSKKN